MGIYLFPIPIWHVTISEFWPSLTKDLWSWVKILRKWQSPGMKLEQSQGDVWWFGWQVLDAWEVDIDRGHQNKAELSTWGILLSLLPSLQTPGQGREKKRELEVGSAPIGSFQNLLQNNSIITNRQALFPWPQKHTWRQKCGGSEERHRVG